MNSLDTLVAESKKIFHGENEIMQIRKGEEPVWKRQSSYFYLQFEDIPADNII